MDAGDLISAVSALVAAAAAGVGWWQALSARRAVKAAEEQVKVMRDQLALEHIRPRFEVTDATTTPLGRDDGRLVIEVAQTTGVPLDDVKVELYVGSRQIMTESVRTPLYSAPGSKITFRAHLDVEDVQAPAVRVELSGTEAQGTRRWAERLIAHPVLMGNSVLNDGRTRNGLPRRPSSGPEGPQTSRAPDDVRGRLSKLRRGVQRGRSTGSETNGQGPGPDHASKQDVRLSGPSSAGVAPDAASNDTGPEDDSSR